MSDEPIRDSGSTVLVDTFGRVASDLRISLTDRCSLRCTYCMPAAGLDWLGDQQKLRVEEIVRLASLFVEAGVTTIRLTGGEPLVFPALPEVVSQLAALRPRPELSLTTNAITLERRATDLVGAGLNRVNISLDTLDRERFAAMTRRDRLPAVLEGIAAAKAAGLAPIKINSVLVREQNLAEAPHLLTWALTEGYRLRFIEHMPLDADHTWARSSMVTADEVLEVLSAEFTIRPLDREDSAPAEEFEVLDGPGREHWAVPDGGPGRLGIIASVTRPFCRSCDRLRLTADGQLRTCLFAQHETDLRGPMRDGASDADLLDIVVKAVWGKQAGHGIGSATFTQPERTMSAIGG